MRAGTHTAPTAGRPWSTCRWTACARPNASQALLNALQCTSCAERCTGWRATVGHASSHAGKVAAQGCHQRELMILSARHGARTDLGDHIVHQHLCASGMTPSATFLLHHARSRDTLRIAMHPRHEDTLEKCKAASEGDAFVDTMLKQCNAPDHRCTGHTQAPSSRRAHSCQLTGTGQGMA